jgi:serine/threonine protein phosphatase PrpC
VLVCSDGLWNYASEASAIQSLVADLTRSDPDPLTLAIALVNWANAQGGKDNVSVALARLASRHTEPSSQDAKGS